MQIEKFNFLPKPNFSLLSEIEFSIILLNVLILFKLQPMKNNQKYIHLDN